VDALFFETFLEDFPEDIRVLVKKEKKNDLDKEKTEKREKQLGK
jgi:hypothetical protein